MKPIYLEFNGINSFSERAQIDFAKLLSGGVFGIFGETGSGKSTILDSIHFALYGKIDRGATLSEFINDKSDVASVTFVFELMQNGERKTYRVQRERKRKNGITKATVYEKREEEWFALAEGARDVDGKIEELIGLTFADFKTCIALPQGEFANLVNAPPAERVRLMARLFDLEEYGERLSKRVNEKFYSAKEEVNLIQAKMDENVGGDEESIETLTKQVETQRKCVQELKARLDKAEEAYVQALALQKEKKEYDALCEHLRCMQEKMDEMSAMRKQLQRLDGARQIVEKHQTYLRVKKEKENAKTLAQSAKAQQEQTLALLKTEEEAFANKQYDHKKVNLSLDLERVRAGEKDRREDARIKMKLDECILAYKKCTAEMKEEDFDGKRKQLEEEMQALGASDTLFDFIKNHYQDVLLKDTYASVCEDLRFLKEKYPQTQKDVEEMLKKYVVKGEGDRSPDVENIQAAFKQTEERKKAIRLEMDALDKRQRTYLENDGKRKILMEEGASWRSLHQEILEKTKSLQGLPSIQELEARLKALQESEERDKKRIQALQEKANGHYAEWHRQTGLFDTLTEREEESLASLQKSLQDNECKDVEEATALVSKLGDGERAKEKCTAFFEEYNSLSLRQKQMDTNKFEGFDEGRVQLALAQKIECKNQRDERLQVLGGEEAKLQRLLVLKEKYQELSKELLQKQKHRDICDELHQLLRNNKFLEFIACEYLQEICLSATKTLLHLTGGRYFLKYDKEFKVGDNLNGGALRGVSTLSGGETFLVSLSLALSLSGAICQKSLRPIEFFFLDEGFGTLDEGLIDVVMDVLGKLSKTFSIGLISHVGELQRRIDCKVLVTKANEQHGSKVQMECF